MLNHQARKRFGQNFLVDAHYLERIVTAVAPKPGDRLVEIGPGLAALTRRLIARCGHLAAVEIDRDLVARLRAEFSPEVLELHNADALDFDFASLGSDLRIVGNLPYNISTPILFHLASYARSLRDLHLMLQKEVVLRMAAAPDTPDYGRLSVMLQAGFAVEKLFLVPPGAFRPAPKVDSMVVRLTPLGERAPAIDDAKRFGALVAAAFGQRRKTLRNTLKPWFDATQLEALGVDPGARGETLGVADYVRLANAANSLDGEDQAAPRAKAPL